MTGGECAKHYRMEVSYSIGDPSGYRVNDATHLARLSMGRSAWDHSLCPMLSPLEAIYAIDKRLHHLCPLWCVLLSRSLSAQPVQPKNPGRQDRQTLTSENPATLHPACRVGSLTVQQRSSSSEMEAVPPRKGGTTAPPTWPCAGCMVCGCHQACTTLESS